MQPLLHLRVDLTTLPVLVQTVAFVTAAAAFKMVFLKDLYELMEKPIDLGRNAGDVVVQVVLKNS
ncbi:MAG: hypothetical protein ABSC03_12850 [Verrucomicrobiota bacterium]|jgi:hypothetical protein